MNCIVTMDASRFLAKINAANSRKVIKQTVEDTRDFIFGAVKEYTPRGTSPTSPFLVTRWQIKPVEYVAGYFQAGLFNDAYYAKYVEYGHKVRYANGGFGWVEGQFFLTRAIQEGKAALPSIFYANLRAVMK